MKAFVHLNIHRTRRLLGVLDDADGGISFQFDPEFVRKGPEVSPFAVPLSTVPWRSTSGLFDGLPGFIADSLPDGWGNLLLDRQLRRLGRRLSDVSPVERLCRTGTGGMGALEFEPASDEFRPFEPEIVRLDSLARDIDCILEELSSGDALDRLAGLNGSSGGARPKIVCLVSSDRLKIARGQEAAPDASPWIIKFRSSSDDAMQGVHEYVCSLIARMAGVDMPPTHLFASSAGPGWFGIERFDRTPEGKLFMTSAAGLLHCNFRLPALDYETVLAVSLRLTGRTGLLEAFRRCVLNVELGNCDDHAKNFSWLLNEKGEWRLSPAYDVVTSDGPRGEHMTSILGKGRDVSRADLLRLAARFRIPQKEASEIIDRISDAVSRYGTLIRPFGVRTPPSVKTL